MHSRSHSPSSSHPLERRARPCPPGTCPERGGLEEEGTQVDGGYRSPGRQPRSLLPHGCCGRQRRGGRSSVAPQPSRPPAGSRLNRVAGVIQLKNNLPLWGYFYPGISPQHPDPHAAERPSETNRYRAAGGAQTVSRLLGRDKRVTEQGQLSRGDTKALQQQLQPQNED